MKRKVIQLCAVLLMVIISLPSASLTCSGAETVDEHSESTERYCCCNTTAREVTDPEINTVEDYYEIVNKNDGKSVAALNASPLRSFVDNSTSPYFPEIGDQGKLGSCNVFATTYYQFTYTMNKERGVATTKDNTFSVKWIHNLINQGTNQGTSENGPYNALQDIGCPSAKSVPYDDDYRSWSCDYEIWREAMRYRLEDYQYFKQVGHTDTRISSPDDPDLLPIKTALNNGEVLRFTSPIDHWNYSLITENADIPENEKYIGHRIVTHTRKDATPHAMVIVGYNDDIWCDINRNNEVDSGEMGAFKIANSWGPGWHNYGFMWIAYDALNGASMVDGAKSIADRDCLAMNVSRIDVCAPNNDNEIYAKFTLNTADRSQFMASFSAQQYGAQYNNDFLSSVFYRYLQYGEGYDGENGRCAFDGTNVACDATFVYPLTNLVPNLNRDNFEACDFSVTVKDSYEDNKPLTIKNISIVNEYTGEEYPLRDKFPILVNGSQYSADIKKGSGKNTIIYYIGFDNPTLHYKTENGEFEEVVMQKCTDLKGYLYRHIIEGETGDITLYFTDESGNIDNNSGKYYTAQQGVNHYRTENVHKPLKLNDFSYAYGTPDLSKYWGFDLDIEGGYAPYKYRCSMRHLRTTDMKYVLFTFGYDHDYELYPQRIEYAGEYTITIEVMDITGKTAKLTKTMEVIDQPMQIASLTYDKPCAVVSQPIEFESVSLFEGTSLAGRPESRFFVKDDKGNTIWEEISYPKSYDKTGASTVTPFTYTPTKAGNYTLTVQAFDGISEHVVKTIPFSVSDMIFGDTDGNGHVSIIDATEIQRYLADLIDEDAIYKKMANCDDDTEINILDATCIQRYLAELDDFYNTGNIVEYKEPTYTITLKSTVGWQDTVYCHYTSNKNLAVNSQWPGVAMTKVSEDENGQAVYTLEVPMYAKSLTFSCGMSETLPIKYPGGNKIYCTIDNYTGSFYEVVEIY